MNHPLNEKQWTVILKGQFNHFCFIVFLGEKKKSKLDTFLCISSLSSFEKLIINSVSDEKKIKKEENKPKLTKGHRRSSVMNNDMQTTVN